MSSDFAAARLNMVESQVRTNDVTDLALQDALRVVPREACLPDNKRFLAYADTEVEYAPGFWMLRPRDVAKLLHAVSPRAGETALAIAAPYAAAVLREMGLSVEEKAEDLKTVAGKYDVIVCEGAVEATPDSWKAALAPGGRLGVIERPGAVGRAMVYVRSDEDVGARVVFDSSPPILPGLAVARGFAF